MSKRSFKRVWLAHYDIKTRISTTYDAQYSITLSQFSTLQDALSVFLTEFARLYSKTTKINIFKLEDMGLTRIIDEGTNK